MKMTQARKLQYAQQALAKERAMREKGKVYDCDLFRNVRRILSKTRTSSPASIRIGTISEIFGYNSFKRRSQYSLSDASFAAMAILWTKSLRDSARFASR